MTLWRPGYQIALARELDRLSITVVGLTECRMQGSGMHDVEDATVLYSGNEIHTNGVALMLRKEARRSVTSWHPVSDRLLFARLLHRHGHLSVVVAYAPTEQATDVDKNQFYDQLNTTIRSVHRHDELVLLGDFNAVTGESQAGLENVIGNFGSGITNDNSFRLLTFCAMHNLNILGSWFQRKCIRCFTWKSHDLHTLKEIDHIISRNRTMFTSLRTYRSAES